MNKRRVVRARAGMGLTELLIAITLMGIVGLAAMRTFLAQTRFAELQHKTRFARAVSRSSINFLLSEMRMVETKNGVAAASDAYGASSVTLRVPIVMSVLCGTVGGSSVLSTMPADSAVLAGAALSGFAYRAVSGDYTYTEGAVAVVAGGAAVCTAANITTVAGGRVITITPGLPAAAIVGSATFLYQRVKYSFANSVAIPGRLGLWRTLEATNSVEELAAPFDVTSRFRFYRNLNDTSDVTVPALNEIKGLELVLTGASETPRYGRAAPETAPLRTAVFFVNRID
jgi:type II secretory pathway pseudopilin PulG